MEKIISIIVPAYNASKDIEACIQSLLSLNTSSIGFEKEIIIVDNNSTDSTAAIIKKFPVKYLLQNQVQSSYASRNYGIKNSSGDIIAFTDSDCVADPNWILKAVELFDDPKVGAVAGNIKGGKPINYIDQYLVDRNTLSQEGVFKHFFMPYAQTANAVYHRNVFDRIGYFEEKWISGGDADLAWRMQMQTNWRLVYSKDTIIYHLHRSSLKGFWGQRRTWGRGEVLLYKKYRGQYAEKNPFFKTPIKLIYWEYSFFFRRLAQIIKEYWQEPSFRPRLRLDILAMAGRRYGRIRGSLSEKIFFP